MGFLKNLVFNIIVVLQVFPKQSEAALQWGKGWNLGNTLEAHTEGSMAPAAQEYYFDDVLSKGFSVVRIPVQWDGHTEVQPPYVINATFLSRVKTVVDWSLSRNFITIVNTHHEDWLDNSTTFNDRLPRFIAIWTQISALFAGYDNKLVFEVFNEPHLMSLENLNAMNNAILPILRSKPGLHPTRTVLLGGLEYMGFSWLFNNPFDLVLPKLADGSEDPNLAVEVHSYDPFHFTSPPISIPSWGSAADIEAMTNMVANVSSWSTLRRPAGTPPLLLFLGEFACSHLQSNETARLLWYSTFSTLIEKESSNVFLSWAIWDDDGWYKTYDRIARTWDAPVLQALGML